MEPTALPPELVEKVTNVNIWALGLLVIFCCMVLFGSRRSAVFAFLGIAAFLPLGQVVVMFNLNFQFFRIMILVGVVRVLMRGEFATFRMNNMDRLFIVWALVGAVCGAIREPNAILGVNSLGSLFNAFGAYFLFRIFIREPKELNAYLGFLGFAVVVMAAAMTVEYSTGRNPFSVFGGVTEMVPVRDGRLRCQGPFRSPILTGTFAATLVPPLIVLWLQSTRHRLWLAVSIAACGFVTVVASSSGALLTLLTEIAGFALWIFRKNMGTVRLAAILGLVVIGATMTAPIWYLTARLSEMVGGTGWHRAYLIDQTIAHFGEWWAIGSSYTAHWAPAGQVLAMDPNNMDITNHYIAQGLQGGLLRMVLFIAIIVGCFKVIGGVMRIPGRLPVSQLMVWALGITLAGHCMAFISVSYFDQIEIFWYWLLAVIAGIPVVAWRKAAATGMDGTGGGLVGEPRAVATAGGAYEKGSLKSRTRTKEMYL
jgi:hypothetical protein